MDNVIIPRTYFSYFIVLFITDSIFKVIGKNKMYIFVFESRILVKTENRSSRKILIAPRVLLFHFVQLQPH